MNESELFNAAVKLTAAERVKFLEVACRDDQELRGQVEALLKAHFDSATFLHESDDQPADRRMREARAPAGAMEHPGTMIAGRYKLIEAIGEGGMGAVWLAEQKEPVKRKVAIKLIKAGMDSQQVLARFEAERQALALMDHPNIAKVFDGGMTDQGRPFFVMEYVKGVPLTDYCDQARLSLKERLNLFMPICQAVQHAHQKGIIHRDLKPSNLLICLYDGKPVPKVIDFGLAKAMHQSLTEQSLHTAHGMMVGTPLYMSPEQAEYNNLDVDTRTDIYSLGVILYELLTGSTPLERQQMKEAAFNEILRLIKEVEPPKPSTRLSGSASLPSIAAQRSIEPGQLKRSLTGDLDWIVMKALDKERSRRYETASGLSRDLERFLNDETVEACPPSAAYRLRKYIRRNRGQVIAVATVLAALLLGMAGTTWGMFEARNQAGIARREAAQKETARQREAERAEGERLAKLEAQAQKAAAEQQQRRAEAGERLAGERLLQVEAEKKRAETERYVSEAVRVFLQDRLLRQADVATQADMLLGIGGVESVSRAQRNPTIRELLDRAALELAPGQIEDSFPGLPLVQAEILQTMGQSYDDLGEFDQAIGFLQRSLALRREHLAGDDPEIVTSLSNLAYVHQLAGNFPEAVALQEEALRMLEQLVANDPQEPSPGLTPGQVPDRNVVQRQLIGARNNLAVTYLETGKPELAYSLLKRSLADSTRQLGPNHRNTLSARNNLSYACEQTGRMDEAASLHVEVLRRSEEHLGRDHPATLGYMSNLALFWKTAGRLDEALALCRDALPLFQEKLGPDHPGTLTCMNNLALVHLAKGNTDLAIPIMEEVLKTRERVLGHEHPNTLLSMANLADARYAAAQDSLAVPLYEETLKLRRKILPPNHPQTLESILGLACSYLTVGKPGLAVPLLEEGIGQSSILHGPDHVATLQARHNLAVAWEAEGKLEAARSLHQEVLERRNSVLGADHVDTEESRLSLARAHRAAGRVDLALALYQQSLQRQEQTLGPDHADTINSLNRLAVFCWEEKRLDLSIPLFEDAVRRSEAKWGRDHLQTLTAVANLGVNYKSAGRLPEGLPLMQEGWRAATQYPNLRFVGTHLLAGLVESHQTGPATALITEMLTAARQDLGPASPELATKLAFLAESLLQLEVPAQAEPLLRECLTIREQLPADDWTTFSTMSMLGAALLGQQRFSEAEPQLLAGFTGLQARELEIPAVAQLRLRQAAERLVALYTAWNLAEPGQGHEGRAAEWQSRLDELAARDPPKPHDQEPSAARDRR